MFCTLISKSTRRLHRSIQQQSSNSSSLLFVRYFNNLEGPGIKSKVFNEDGTVKKFKVLDMQAELDKMHKAGKSSQSGQKEKNHMNVQTDGPMGVGIISQDALKKYRPKISDSPLKGVIFDLTTLLNMKPSNPDAAVEDNVVSDDSWNIGKGGREMLMYLESRGVRVALLPRMFNDNSRNKEFTINTFETKMNYTFPYQADNAAFLKDVEKSLKDVTQKMSLTSKDVMCVSMSEGVIDTAKKINMISTSFRVTQKGKRDINWKASDKAIYKIEELGQLKEHVEELNGITFRK